MRLSEFKNEEALDVLADILEPAALIVADDEVKRLYNSGQPKLKLAAYIIKNHKKSVIEIMARLDGQDPATYSITLISLPLKIVEILNDPQIVEFFTSQAQENE